MITIKNIKDLQELEKYMFQNLQSLNKSSAGSVQESDIIKKRIEELSAMRVALFSQLKTMYKDQQQQTATSRSNLADQLTMTSVIDNELTNSREIVFFFLLASISRTSNSSASNPLKIYAAFKGSPR